MALDLPLPKKIYAHGFIMMKDGKMSKSKGNVVYPEMLVEKYGLDATRYYLLREFNFGQDALFTPEEFVDRYNYDLCNDLGNLLNRTIGMINKYFKGKIPEYNGIVNDVDEELEKYIRKQISVIEEQMDNYDLSKALEEIWKIISRTNKYIDQTEPWILFKEESTEKLKSVMIHLVESLRIIGILIRSAMKNTSNEIFTQLGIENINKEWDSIYEFGKLFNNSEFKVIEKPTPVFNRLDSKEEIEYIKNNMK